VANRAQHRTISAQSRGNHNLRWRGVYQAGMSYARAELLNAEEIE